MQRGLPLTHGPAVTVMSIFTRGLYSHINFRMSGLIFVIFKMPSCEIKASTTLKIAAVRLMSSNNTQ